MATYTSIPTFTSGQVLTSSRMNDIKNNLDLGNAQSQSFARNLLDNGAFQILQRTTVGTGVTGKTASGYYTADRWNISLTSGGTWTQSVEADAPTASGLRNSLKMACTTATGALGATNVATVEQRLEGYNVQRILKGSASAQQLTVSFWVKSNVTGSYIVELQDVDNTRYVSAAYTISASGTWEQKTVTFPADTTGAFDNDANESLRLNFWLVAGTNYTSGTLGTTWHTTTANRLGGPTTYANVGSANTNTWQLTGVQLETGSVSTPFEVLPFGEELRRCQRYFNRIGGVASGFPLVQSYGAAAATAYHSISFPTTMRTAPVGSKSGTWAVSNCGQPSVNYISSHGFGISTLITALGTFYFYPDSTDDYLDFTAEL